jgi:COMPASS component SPP1
VSKYCSDECAVKFMQSKIRRWGGDKASLWEGVKDADRREAVVMRCIMDDDSGDKPHKDGVADTRVEVVKPTKSKAQRELDRLNLLLSRLPIRRSALKKEEDILFWRDGLVQLAVTRANMTGECGWDQRLCFGDDEVVEFGSEALQTYNTVKAEESEDAMQVDGSGEWWCRGKKKCDRHAGYADILIC